MKEKHVLIIYPFNFVKHIHGIDTRYFELVTYLKSKGFIVDLYSLDNYSSEWDEKEIKESKIVDNLFLFDVKSESKVLSKKKTKRNLKEKLNYRFKNGVMSGLLTFTSGRLNQLATKFSNSLPQETTSDDRIAALPDLACQSMKNHLSSITASTKYDYVLVGYVYWANLIHDVNLKDAVKIIDVNDFISLQYFYLHDGSIRLGNFLEEEIRRINMFDVALCISDDERMFFSQFAPSPTFFYVPQFFPKRELPSLINCAFDILFIGSDNPHNQKSIKWFFDCVFPILDKTYKILLVGKITNHVDDYSNVTKIRFADDLDNVYKQVKISICPMLQGTGMKIKVVEALSYGKPIVCTIRGVDGFNQKKSNGCIVADNPEEFAGAISMLLNDDGFYNHHQQLATHFFEENFEQTVVNKTLEKVFTSVSEQYQK